MTALQKDLEAVEAELRKEFSEAEYSDEDNALLSRALTEEEIQEILVLVRPFAEIIHGAAPFPAKMTESDKEELITVLKEFNVVVERVEVISPKRPSLPEPLSWMIPDDAHWHAFVGEAPLEADALRNMLDGVLAGYAAEFEKVLRKRAQEKDEKAHISLNQEDYHHFLRRPEPDLENAMAAIGAVAIHRKRPDADDPNGKHWYEHGQKAIPLLKRILPFLSRYEMLGFKPGEKGTLCVYAE